MDLADRKAGKGHLVGLVQVVLQLVVGKTQVVPRLVVGRVLEEVPVEVVDSHQVDE